VPGMSGQRRDSLTLGDNATLDNAATPTESTQEGTPVRLHSRSSSPAKRRASEMDEDGNGTGGERMDVDRPSSPNATTATENEQPRTTTGSRTVRGTSVDMLAQQPYLTSGDPSPKSSHSDGISESTPNTSTASATSTDKDMDDADATMPSLDDQVRTIASKAMAALEDDQAGYVVSTQWLQRVMSRCTEGEQYGPFDKTATEGEIGPVDNTPLLPSG
jgi:ubiquitin carboxyl-terminal hydrolase 4/11/15